MLLSLLNSVTCLALGLGLLWMILTPKVDDGVVIKLGLIVSDVGFLALGWKLYEGVEPWEIEGVEVGILMVNSGVLVVVLGYLWRAARHGHKMRRQTDWAALQDTRPLDDAEMRHVGGGRRP